MPAGDTVVASVEFAISDTDVSTWIVNPTTEMNSVVTTEDFDSSNFHVAREFQQDRVVPRVVNGYVLKPDILAVSEKHSVGASNTFFALGVDDITAVNDSLACNRNILSTIGEN